MIVYFSGTGNSRYCARALAHMLGDRLTDSFHFIRDGIGADLSDDRPWVFVSPTYGWQLPHIFGDFIRSGSFSGCRDAYFVMTCGSEMGNADRGLRRLCKEKGFDYRGVLEIVMPENYIAMFEVPDEAESARIVAQAGPRLSSGAETIRRGEAFPAAAPGLLDRVKTSLVNPLFYSFCISSRPFYSTDACIGCGVCAEVCPLGGVRLEGGRPVWNGRCTHCMACISSCPVGAIEYGRKSLGKPRYRCPEYLPEGSEGESRPAGGDNGDI